MLADRNKFWLIFLLWGGVLFVVLYFTHLISPYSEITSESFLVEQLLYTFILVPYPAFLVFWTPKRCQNAMAFQRLALCGASKALVIFTLQVMLFVLFSLTAKMHLPGDSNLFSGDLPQQVATFSRVPILSQFVGMYLFLAAFLSRTALPGDKHKKHIIIGLIFYVPYLVGFYFCQMLWEGHFLGLLLPPNKVNLLLIFAHWFPTVYFLALTYIFSVIRKK